MRKRVCLNFTRERKEEIDELGFDQCKILNSKLIPPLKQVEEELSRKTNKKVDVVSSHHKIDDNGAIADKNKEDKKTIREENSDVDKKQPKQVPIF